jgi:hypothetical protein
MGELAGHGRTAPIRDSDEFVVEVLSTGKSCRVDSEKLLAFLDPRGDSGFNKT